VKVLVKDILGRLNVIMNLERLCVCPVTDLEQINVLVRYDCLEMTVSSWNDHNLLSIGYYHGNRGEGISISGGTILSSSFWCSPYVEYCMVNGKLAAASIP